MQNDKLQTTKMESLIERGASILHAINPGTSVEYFKAHLSRTDSDWSVGFPLADAIKIKSFLEAVEGI